MATTPEQRKAYIESGGVVCLYCGDSNLQTGDIDAQEMICQQVVCLNCKKEWTDEYTLTGVTTDDE